jgi:peptidoglycan hydrolase-like protein with peptidoglycan-binding domain
MTGSDVKQLQIFLNSQGFTVAKKGAGSLGYETTYFGLLTQKALAKFQKANGITPAVGYFGPITRSFINIR